MASLGMGIAGITGPGKRFQMASEQLCLGQSLARRLITPRGSMPWAPNDGTDMRDYLNQSNTPATRFAAVRAAKDECEKDERVESAAVTVTFNYASASMTIAITINTANGPFNLVLLVDSLTITILAVNS